jgi:hypothetical protein
MAIGTAGDFKIYPEQFFGGMSEVIEQEAEVFNAASGGSLVLAPARLKGDYEKESFLKAITNLVSRRVTTGSAAYADAGDLPMTQGEIVGVKVNRKIGPVANTLDAWRKIGANPQTMSFQLGKQIGKAVALDYVNTSIAAVTAALKGVAALNFDATGAPTKTLTHSHMVSGMAKMGDAASSIVAWAMHSKPYYDLMGQAIADKIFEIAGATIYAGTVATFGKPVVVTDAPALWDLNGSATDTYNVLGLVPAAAVVKQSEDQEVVSQLVTGKENLVMRVQGEYAFNVNVKGFTWDVTNGGANPTDGAIATSSNWDKAATADKSLAGVCIKVQ